MTLAYSCTQLLAPRTTPTAESSSWPKLSGAWKSDQYQCQQIEIHHSNYNLLVGIVVTGHVDVFSGSSQ